MFPIKGLVPGDKISIAYRSRNYNTVVQDLPKPDVIVVAQPTYQGIFLNIDEAEMAEVYFHKENGIVSFYVVQMERFTENSIPLLRLRAVTETSRSQRRNYYRLDKVLPMQIHIKPEDGEEDGGSTIPARTINISGGGCKVAVRQPVGNEKKVECRIMLYPNVELIVEGIVVWVEQQEGQANGSLVGVQFADNDENTRRKIVGYITSEQRKKLSSKLR